MASATLPLASSSSVSPIPTVVPTLPEYQDATETGTRTLWVVFVIMLLATIVFSGMAWTVPISKRLYHIVTTLIVIFASLSYFAMASGHGISYHHVVVRESHKHVPDTTTDLYRQVYWARYVDWSLTTPLLLLDLALLAGLSGGVILMIMVADIIMILTGLFAAFGTEDTPQKWGWYAIACIAYLVVIWHLVIHGRATAMNKGGKVGNFFAAIGGFTLVIWTVYPIIWGIADGSRNMNVDEEIIAYAVLDILAKPVFGAWLLFTHASMPESNVELGGFWSEGLKGEGNIRVGDDDEGPYAGRFDTSSSLLVKPQSVTAEFQQRSHNTNIMAEQEANDAVDRSPIAQLERRNSLEKFLQGRPEAQELKNRHILLDTTSAPTLQGLEKRPEREDLVEKNILANSTAAPSLQEKQRELQMHMRANSLEKHLQTRPKPEELVKEGILQGG
ncbi:hypothetical protein LTR15_002038 [Elasticomyces elasticus]|nr:hypothetical protein LTR15_002038 [Elasticomyces elasticus]